VPALDQLPAEIGNVSFSATAGRVNTLEIQG
jgi:hypothetical protein